MIFGNFFVKNLVDLKKFHHLILIKKKIKILLNNLNSIKKFIYLLFERNMRKTNIKQKERLKTC